jgi:hypothetical protein
MSLCKSLTARRYDLSPLRVTIKEIQSTFASFMIQVLFNAPFLALNPFTLSPPPHYVQVNDFFSCVPLPVACMLCLDNWKCKPSTLTRILVLIRFLADSWVGTAVCCFHGQRGSFSPGDHSCLSLDQ